MNERSSNRPGPLLVLLAPPSRLASLMTADEMEALSFKYSDSVLIILPLSSGQVAIFDNSRQLLTIVEALQHWQIKEFSKIASLKLKEFSKIVSLKLSPQPQSSAEELGF